MRSVTAALTWEYLARNRWVLLLTPLIASAIALITMLPFSSIDVSSAPPREMISIHLVNVLCLVVIIGGLVMQSQGSMSSLYLKPLSTTAIVNYFYWGGAFLVACQVALMLWVWRIFFVSDWPIIGSVLFAVVFWGVFQPVFRGSLNSLSWIMVAPAVFVTLVCWLMAKHGMTFQRGGAISPQIHYWTSISGTDSLIAMTTLCISYVWTWWRVHYDRSGRRRRSLTDRVAEFFEYVDARSVSRVRLFESPVHAQTWYDFVHRTATMPWPVLCLIPWFWLIGIIAGALTQELSLGLTFAFLGAYAAAGIQTISAFFASFSHYLGQTVILEPSSGGHTITKNPLPLGMSPYLFSLPMSDRQRAHAILRSSAGACGSASAVILLSLTVVFGLSWVLGADLFKGNEKGPTKLDTIVPWSIVAVWGGSLLLSFVFATIVFTLDFRKWKLRDWITPVILVATLLACFTPIALSLSMGLCAIAAGFAVYATVQAVLREDISWVGASLVWLAGFAFFAVLLAGLPKELGDYGLALGSILVLLAMLPFFTTAAAIRNLRTT